LTNVFKFKKNRKILGKRDRTHLSLILDMIPTRGDGYDAESATERLVKQYLRLYYWS